MLTGRLFTRIQSEELQHLMVRHNPYCMPPVLKGRFGDEQDLWLLNLQYKLHLNWEAPVPVRSSHIHMAIRGDRLAVLPLFAVRPNVEFIGKRCSRLCVQVPVRIRDLIKSCQH